MKVNVITDNAWERLETFARDAMAVRAVMAYWTIPACDLPSHFSSALCRKDSFLCVDINQPTSIDALHALHLSGIDAWLHLMTTTGFSEIDDSSKMPNHLMHSKAIIFDYLDGRAVVWVGSHNGTFRALDGINYECTLAIETDCVSSLYKEVLAHIKEIQTACQLFRPELMDHYRHLQGAKREDAVGVMEFENGNDQPLVANEEITVFNMSRDDLRSFKTIDTDVIVSLHGNREILYSAKVVQTGETPSPKSQKFGARRYADRQRSGLPMLVGKAPVTPAQFKRSTYFASVKILAELDPSNHLLEIPAHDGWVVAPSVAIDRFVKPDVDLPAKRSVKPKGLTFKVPAFEEMIDMKMDISPSFAVQELRLTAFKEMQLAEKKSIKRPALIRRKLLVRH
jgi:hypothetical protein